MSNQPPIVFHAGKVTRNIITPILMALLLLLASINYVIYSSDCASFSQMYHGPDSPIDTNESHETINSPSGPDEKNPDGSFSFSEDYLPIADGSFFFRCTFLTGEYPSYSEKLPAIPFKLVSPPPEC